jgi:hypothetical protein
MESLNVGQTMPARTVVTPLFAAVVCLRVAPAAHARRNAQRPQHRAYPFNDK